jgi:ABC-type cobalt transport system substrate-binding protein
MKRSKKIFLILAAVFIVLMVIIGIDISQRTTWPGADRNLEERIKKE